MGHFLTGLFVCFAAAWFAAWFVAWVWLAIYSAKKFLAMFQREEN